MRKLKILLITIFVFTLSIIFGNEIFAANTINLNIKDIRPYTSKEYTVVTGTTPNIATHTIFKIIKKDGTTSSHSDALYCLRNGLGFGNTEFTGNESEVSNVTYTESFNLKTNATDVMNFYRNEIGYNISNTEYNSLLWIIDNMYLPEHKDSQEMKENLFKKAGIVDAELTDDDIEFVQQMALWYFTNYDERNEEHTLSLADTQKLSPLTKIDGKSTSNTRGIQIDTLYRYFIDNAKRNGDIYGVGDIREINIETNNKKYKTTATLWLADEKNQQPVLKVQREEILEGYFDIIIQKIDEEGKLLTGAVFNMMKENRQVVAIPPNGDGTFNSPAIPITENGQIFIYEIEEISTPSGYIGIDEIIKLKVSTKLDTTGTKYIVDKVEFINTAGETIAIDGVTFELLNNTITIKVVNQKQKVFDFALRKYITKINGTEITNTKEPEIDISRLNTFLTAEYAHRKDAVEVATGDRVTYKISVYNEGDLYGKVTEIIDYLPEGLEFEVRRNPELIEAKEEYAEGELEGKKYKYIYNNSTGELRILPIEGTYLFELQPFDGVNLDTESLEVVCTVTAEKEIRDRVLTNIATMKYEPSNADVLDIDSLPESLNLPTNINDWENYQGNTENKPYLGDKEYFYQGREDDDDFDKVVIKGAPYDLSLRKFITKVNGAEVEERTPQINTSKLNTVDETTGQKITTAIYTHSKEPVYVKKGDIITYTIRIYNEGELNGYATEIAEHIPEGLGYLIDYKENTDNFWVPVADSGTKTIDLVGTEGVYETENVIKNLKIEDFYSKTSLNEVKILAGNATLYSTAIEDEIIKGYNPELKLEDIDEEEKWQQTTNGTDGLYYQDVEITCIVLADNVFEGALGSIAEIQEDKAVDENDEEVNAADRDSNPDNLDKENYNPSADNSTYQQDDDDYELIKLKYFDLALRKYITSVNGQEIETRVPKVIVNDEGKIEYVHDKTPVQVTNSDIVTYTIRVYNEGTVAGTAMEISDEIPEGLIFLSEHELNKEYGWKMYDINGIETTNPFEAVKITTKYLENTKLNPYDATKELNVTNPSYADVKVIFQVMEEEMTVEDRILINKSQIIQDKAVDEVSDKDSNPDEWNEGEDDQDIEKIYVKKFDLALLKWVTQTVVTVDGKTTTTSTGFTPYDDAESIAKVVVNKNKINKINKINKTTVKIIYNIMITNQGEIAGYATEITNYIPEGLKFVQEDNPNWVKGEGNKITTRALEEKLLEPGESAIVEVILTWENDKENLGTKTNIAEISEHYNEKAAKDIDSEPDNVELENYEKQQEDDDGKAIVILEPKTGGGKTYIWLGLTVLLIIAGGIILIQKFVM